MWALLASMAMAGPGVGATGGGNDPVLQRAVPGGDAAQVLMGAASASGVAIALEPGDLRGLRLPGLRKGESLRRALARLCPAAGLVCQIGPLGMVVRKAPAPRPAPRMTAPPPTPPLLPAHDPPPPPASPPPANIVVTGRHGAGIMLESERSFSLSSLSAENLRRQPPLAMAELLQTIPGLWIDTSAGTSANTARLRGIPMDGYTAMAVEEDDLPIQHTSLPWTDIDQFMRPDIMLESVDFVRGGPSGVLASNAPGGILNLHLRRPPASFSGEARITTTSYGLARGDGWIGGPLGDWRVITGGYLARDPTLRHITQTLGGGQWRLRGEHDLPDGRLTLTARYQDDASLNTSSYPMVLRNGQWSALPGFDPRRGSWFGPDFNTVRFLTANGAIDRAVGRNNRNRVFDLAGALTHGGWTARLRLRRSDTERNSLLSSGAPVSVADFWADTGAALRQNFPGATTILRRSDGSILPASALLEVIQPTSATVQLDEMIAQVEHAQKLGAHNLATGLYAVINRWRYQRIVARALVEAQSQGELVDALALNGAGQTIASLTDGGYLSRAATWEQTTGRTASLALYATDEWQIAPRWRVDAGLRGEWEALRGVVGLPRSLDLSTATQLANRALQVDSGQSAAYANNFTATNATLALHWQARPERIGLFVRASLGHVLPSVGNYRTSATPSTAHRLNVAEAEAGLVLTQNRWHLGITGFANRFTGLDVSSSMIDSTTGAITLVPRQAASHNLGLEAELRWTPNHWLRWQGSFTWQQSRLADYRMLDTTGAMIDYNGHVPQRIPDVMANSTLSIAPDGAPWRLGLNLNAMGRRYADDANALRLPPFVMIGLQAGWQGRHGRLDGEISNLGDAIAVMQGDAIAGNSQKGGGANYAVGRALAGRMLRLSYTLSW